MGRTNWVLRIFVLAAPILGVICAVLFQNDLTQWAEKFPQCPFYRVTGLLCPACGNTRSVLALLRLDIVSALQYNITPPIIAVLGILLYAEMAARVFGKRLRLVPRSNVFLGAAVGGILLYYLLRNWIG